MPVCPYTIAELHALIDQLRADPTNQPRTLTGLNAHIANLVADSPALREQLQQMRCVTADGVSVLWAGRRKSPLFRERCNTTDAFRPWLARDDLPASRAILVGGDFVVAAKAAAAIEDASPHLNIVGNVSGYLEDEQILSQLKGMPACDYILVGMGTPKSERMLLSIAAQHPTAIIWHIGGGTITFFAGTAVEAPRWMRRAGVQWIHRLAQDPRGMWRRYLLGNPNFVWRVLRGG